MNLAMEHLGISINPAEPDVNIRKTDANATGGYFILAIILMLSTATSLVNAESLEDAWKTALIADQRVQAAHRQTESVKQQLLAAKAERLPNLRVEGGYTVLDNPPAILVDLPIPGVALNELPVAEDQSFACQAFASLPLYTSGRISRGIDAAGAMLKAVEADVARTVLDIRLGVAQAYVTVLRAQRAVEVAQANEVSLASHAWDVENLFDQGMVARNDLLAARVVLADAKQIALQVRNRLDIAQSAYNRLLGRPLTHSTVLDDLSAKPDAQVDVGVLTRKALANRPELEILKQQAQALKQQAALARAASSPQIALNGGYRFQENKYQVHEGAWSATLGLRWDIFDRGVSHHKAQSLLEQAQAHLHLRDDLSSRIALGVRKPWLDSKETQKRIAVTKAALEQAEENLQVTKDRYRSGLGTNTEVLDAETLRTNSYNSYHNALYDNVLAQFRLRHAVGEL